MACGRGFAYGGVIAQWATRLSVFDNDIQFGGWRCEFFPNLKDLRVFINWPHHVTSASRKWWTKMTSTQLAATGIFELLAKIRGLWRFCITTKCGSWDCHRESAWTENLAKLESLLVPHATKPKEASKNIEETAYHAFQPLYAASAVCFGTSQMRPVPELLQDHSNIFAGRS